MEILLIKFIVLLKFIWKYEGHVPLVWIASYLVCLIICEFIIESKIWNFYQSLILSFLLQIPNYMNGAP